MPGRRASTPEASTRWSMSDTRHDPEDDAAALGQPLIGLYMTTFDDGWGRWWRGTAAPPSAASVQGPKIQRHHRSPVLAYGRRGRGFPDRSPRAGRRLRERGRTDRAPVQGRSADPRPSTVPSPSCTLRRAVHHRHARSLRTVPPPSRHPFERAAGISASADAGADRHSVRTDADAWRGGRFLRSADSQVYAGAGKSGVRLRRRQRMHLKERPDPLQSPPHRSPAGPRRSRASGGRPSACRVFPRTNGDAPRWTRRSW